MEERHLQIKSYREWNLSLKVDFQGLLKAGIKAFAGKIFGETELFKGAVEETFDAIQVRIEASAENRAYLLLYLAMQDALVELAKENEAAIAGLLNRSDLEKGDPEFLLLPYTTMEKVFEEAEKREFRLTANFMQHPDQIGLVNTVQVLFSEWLMGLGIHRQAAEIISGRIPMIFVRKLNDRWGAKKEYFSKIKEHFDDAFSEEGVLARMRYTAHLKANWEKPIFDEYFGLPEVYIPLRVGYEMIGAADSDEYERLIKIEDGDTYIRDWLAIDSPDFQVLVLKGGPGSGKSSLMKKLAYELSAANREPVYFIELHKIDFDRSVQKAIDELIKDFFPTGVFDRAFEGAMRRPVLIFDGLDELSSSGETGMEVAKRFVEDLLKLIDRVEDNWMPRCILTGREMVLYHFERDFEFEGQIVELQPYELKSRYSWQRFIGDQEVVSLDQRKIWWGRYLGLKRMPQNIPAFLEHENFSDLSTQPLLNFLLALSFMRGKIDFDKGPSLNQVYFDLIERVLDRPWGKHNHLKWTIDEFLLVMEEVATAAWHSGDVRTVYLMFVMYRCRQNPEASELIQSLGDDGVSSYLRLLTAFYVQPRSDERRDISIEFTHKSFAEYLVARKIIRFLGWIEEGLRTPKYFNKNLALSEWRGLFGKEMMTSYIWDFLLLVIKDWVIEIGAERAIIVQSFLDEIFNELLENGFEVTEKFNSKKITDTSRNMELSLWGIVAAISRHTKQTVECTYYYDFLNRLWGWRHFGNDEFLKETFCWREFDPNANFDHENLTDFRFDYSSLNTAMFEGATLTNASFRNSEVDEGQFEGARLDEADFSHASLIEARLEKVYSLEANFSSANLSRANLSEGDFRAVNFNATILIFADLSDGDFSGANFTDADLSNAVLERANFDNAELIRTNLQGAEYFTIHTEEGELSGIDAKNYFIRFGAINVPDPTPPTKLTAEEMAEHEKQMEELNLRFKRKSIP